jgi:hypothetical protein
VWSRRVWARRNSNDKISDGYRSRPDARPGGACATFLTTDHNLG